MVVQLKKCIKRLALKYIKDYANKTKLVYEQDLKIKEKAKLVYEKDLKIKELKSNLDGISTYGDFCGSFNKYFSPYNSANHQALVYKRFLSLIENIEDAKSVAIAAHLLHLHFMIASTSNNSIKMSNDGTFLSDDFYEKSWRMDKNIVNNLRTKYNLKYGIETIAMAPYSYGLGCLPNGISSQIKDKIIIDAGASSGETAFCFEEYFGPALIYSFEPDRDTFLDLSNRIKLNKKENIIIPYNVALSNSNSNANFYASNKCPGSSSLLGGVLSDSTDIIQEYQVKTQTIDNFMSEHLEVPGIGFIKADVEGAGLLLIKGAVETIKRDRPILVIAIYHSPEEFFGVKPFIENLDLGYKFLIRKPYVANPKCPGVETVLIAYCEK